MFELKGEDKSLFPTEERIRRKIVYSLLDSIEHYLVKTFNLCHELTLEKGFYFSLKASFLKRNAYPYRDRLFYT